MSDTIIYIIFIVIMILFFYFGYRTDYRRNPKKFILTILGVLATCIIFAIAMGLFSNFIDWIFNLFQFDFWSQHHRKRKWNLDNKIPFPFSVRLLQWIRLLHFEFRTTTTSLTTWISNYNHSQKAHYYQ